MCKGNLACKSGKLENYSLLPINTLILIVEKAEKNAIHRIGL